MRTRTDDSDGQRHYKEFKIMSNETVDSKKKSASEAFVNSFGGYPIGYGVGIVVLPLSMGWIQEDPYMANIVITGVYATVSFVRSYFLRRVFEKHGIDDNFIRLAKRVIIKLVGSVK
jgi:hypothetical protein